MSRAPLGWSYPAGCNGPPGEDWPERCPVCKADNADADGEPVHPADPAFCSAACAALDNSHARAEAEFESRQLAALDELAGAEVLHWTFDQRAELAPAMLLPVVEDRATQEIPAPHRVRE